jgi:hypothetical protein
MNIVKKAVVIGAAAALSYAALPVAPAHAAKVPLFYQTGEDIFVAGDGSLPAPFDKEPDLEGAQSGYKCQIWGLVWAYVSIKDCQPVAFRGDTFWNDAELATAVAKAHPESTMQLGLWKGYGKFPLGIAVFGLIGFGIYSKVRGNDDDDQGEGEGKGDEAKSQPKEPGG